MMYSDSTVRAMLPHVRKLNIRTVTQIQILLIQIYEEMSDEESYQTAREILFRL